MEYHRRAFVHGAGAILGGALGGGALDALGEAGAADAAARDGRTATSRKEWDKIIGAGGGRPSFTCVQTPQLTEGPFYYESSPQRRTIADRRPGMPLRLGITLGGLRPAAGAQCFPLAGAVIDIWHTDAAGLYSNVGGDLQPVDTSGQQFLRGHQVTDENGYVEFDTIMPGWEVVAAAPPVRVARRTTHIHVKAFHEREVLTAQLFFPDALIDQLYAEVEPYRSHQLLTAPGLDRSYERIRNAEDMFYLGSKAQPMTVERVDGVLVAKAVIGVVSQGERGFRTLFR